MCYKFLVGGCHGLGLRIFYCNKLIIMLLIIITSIFILVSTSCGFSTPPLSSSSHTKTSCAGKVIDSPSSTSTSLFIKKDTKVDVDHTATVKITPPPLRHILSHNISLTNYMRLPVEQYVLIPMPLGSSLTTRDTAADNDNILSSNTEFELVVPTITFFKLSLQPVVYASVYPQENQVVISSTQCQLRGSDFIEKVRLNDRFDFSVNTTLTWEDSLEDTDISNIKSRVVNDDDDDELMGCSITAKTRIKVDVDVPRPFNTIPKRIIERSGNAAMHLSLRYIQANFVDNLATDYNKWATDIEYRKFRASLSEKEVVEVVEEIKLKADVEEIAETVEALITQSRQEDSNNKKTRMSKWSKLLKRFKRRKKMQESNV